MKRSFIILALSVLAAVAWAEGDTIVDEWATVQAPPPPALVAPSFEPSTTALLLLDFQGRIIGGRPRLAATVPRVERLLRFARSEGILVAYSLAGQAGPDSIVAALRPSPVDHIVRASVDKFHGTDLETYLKSKGIHTLIVTGLVTEGAVLGTSIGACLRGFKVIVPVDGTASTELYAEQYVAWHLLNAPAVRGNVSLTKIDLIVH